VERPFWERYPLQYRTKDGVSLFSEEVMVTEEHERWLPQEYFPIVAQMTKHPRYNNRRIMDPQIKCFVDEIHLTIESGWGLPKPNQAAAYQSLAKYGKDILPLTDQQVQDCNLAWSYTTLHFGLYMSNARVISYPEAKTHFDMSSSTCPPFNVLYPTKRELFEKDPDMDAFLEQDFVTLAEDPNWTCLGGNSLKEELRTEVKILDNSIRTFIPLGLDANAHGTRLFVDMNEKMYASHLKTASAVGMSPLKGNWDKLYRKLNVFRNGYALDESQYDSSLRVFLMWGCAAFRWNMLADEFKTTANCNRIKTYYRNLINTVIVTPTGALVMKKTGNPSGSVNTITDNTLILYTLLSYAWIRTSRVSGKPEMQSYEAFEEETAKALVGDDNTWTVSDEAHEFFNAISVIDEWKVLGITTTTDSLLPRKAIELDFLSAHTVFIHGVAVPLYERAKLMSSLLYAPKKNLEPSTTLERTAAMLSIGWTDLPFRRFCRELIEWLLFKYDEVCKEDPRWKLAKCQIQVDSTYYKLFLGHSMLLRPQACYMETKERCKKPYKNIMSNVQRKQKAPRRRKPRNVVTVNKVTQPRKTVRQVIVQQKKKSKPRPRGQLAARGSSSNQTTNKRGMTVSQSEYVAEVQVANAPNFNVTTYPVNPGQSVLFPWLSSIARNYEKYEFLSLRFEYKREVSEFATNGQTGKVIMSFDSDASDGPPTLKQQMEDTDPHADAMPCNTFSMVVPKSMLKLTTTNAHYVRTGGLPANADIKTFDLGNLFVATQGVANNVLVGELHVHYTVRLSIPVLLTPGAPLNTSVSMFNQTSGVSLTSTLILSCSWNTTIANGLAINLINPGFSIPVGNYIISYTVFFTGNGTLTQAASNFLKNGNPILNGSNPLFADGPGIGSPDITLNDTLFFVGSVPSDVFTLTVAASFTAGGISAASHIVIWAT